MGTVSRSCEAEELKKHSGTGRWISLLLSGGDGERRRTVGREGWRSTEALRRAFARCTSRVRDCGRSPCGPRTHAWPRTRMAREYEPHGERQRAYSYNCCFARHSPEISQRPSRASTRLRFARSRRSRSYRDSLAVKRATAIIATLILHSLRRQVKFRTDPAARTIPSTLSKRALLLGPKGFAFHCSSVIHDVTRDGGIFSDHFGFLTGLSLCARRIYILRIFCILKLGSMCPRRDCVKRKARARCALQNLENVTYREIRLFYG